jgi:hypothetical protein
MAEKLPRILQITFPPQVGAGILLLNDINPIMGRIILFSSYPEMVQQINAGKFFIYSTLPGYSILIAYEGILGRGRRLDPSQTNYIKEIVDEMAKFYFEQRVEANKSRYKRYLI